MAVISVERNSKRKFFGGGKGSLIPYRPRTEQTSPQNSASPYTLSPEIEKALDDLVMEEFKNALPASNPEGEYMPFDVKKALHAYRRGDRLGAPWESGSAHWSPVTFDQIIARGNQYPKGTDESDIVDCFEKFVSGYEYDGNIDNLLVSWARFHERNRRAARYGGTHKHFFTLVRALDKAGTLTAERLFALSAESKPGGSLGNGCLALALPVYAFSKEIGHDSKELVQLFFRLSHAHEGALGCARYLCDLFAALELKYEPLSVKADCGPVNRFLLNEEWKLPPEEFANRYPNNVLCCITVMHALYGVLNASSEEDLITGVVSMGGDCDGILALSLLMFGLLPQNN